MNQDISVLPYGEASTDEYHSPVVIFGTAVAYKGYLEQTTAEEITDGRDTRVSDWLLMLPASASISALDHVQEGNRTFEVVGKPRQVYNPRIAAVSHVEARLRLVEG